MSRLTEMAGQRFTRLLVLERVPRGHRKSSHAVWRCRCDCGKEVDCDAQNLRRGFSKSCGCISREMVRERMTMHGMSRTPEHWAWQRMIASCSNPNKPDYKNYGGRGIRVCQRWVELFDNFYEDMGPRPSDQHSIDRIDNNGDYEPGNCRWATKITQMNNMRKTRYFSYKGQQRTITEAMRVSGTTIKECTVRARVRSGWSLEDALETPVLA